MVAAVGTDTGSICIGICKVLPGGVNVGNIGVCWAEEG